MQTSAQFFRQEHKLVACALGEPSLTLVQNDSAFGLLLTAGVHEDSLTSRLYLESVTYLHVAGEQWHYDDFSSAVIYANDKGFWVAQDEATRLYFPKPSRQPYHVLFISQDEFRRLQHWRTEGVAFPAFELAQKRFGRLPGFSFRERMLETPEHYATASEAIAAEKYILAG